MPDWLALLRASVLVARCELRSRLPDRRGLAAALALLAPSGIALAQSSSASYEVARQSIDGGAQRAASASYAIEATIGQPDAGPATTGAGYELRGGFHRTATGPLPDFVFADGFEPP